VPITQEPFDDLLAWLDSDREVAGRKYEIIHLGLTRVFISRGFCDAEELADLTVSRVTTLLPKIRDEYVGEPAHFFHKVAHFIALEAWRRPEIAHEVVPEKPSSESSPGEKYEYLLECLELLPENKRELIIEYYLYQEGEKSAHRRRMAKALGISRGALRSRAHNIRDALEDCVTQRAKKFRRNGTRPENHN
jgi:DNA-directed RNA polymerase specialized sigma24 family protein